MSLQVDSIIRSTTSLAKELFAQNHLLPSSPTRLYPQLTPCLLFTYSDMLIAIFLLLSYMFIYMLLLLLMFFSSTLYSWSFYFALNCSSLLRAILTLAFLLMLAYSRKVEHIRMSSWSCDHSKIRSSPLTRFGEKIIYCSIWLWISLNELNVFDCNMNLLD